MLVNRVDLAGPASARRTVRKSGSNFSLSENSDNSVAARSVEGAAGTLPLSSLLALQAAQNFDAEFERPEAHAGEILESLEQIRLNILTGDAPVKQLRHLSDLLAGFRIDEAGAASHILREINLLARVELAKRRL